MEMKVKKKTQHSYLAEALVSTECPFSLDESSLNLVGALHWS